jgi:hypothetical protein
MSLDERGLPAQWRFAGAVQTHLKIGAVDDPQEREAERIADHAVAVPAPSPDALPGGLARESATSSPSPGNAQNRAQRAPSPDPPVALPENTQSVLRRLPESAGRPLDRGTRSSMEPRLGIDLSGVQVHDDSAAAEMAQNLGARAFTLRQHIFFNRNEHAPSSQRGRRLLAHELAHVRQQATPPTKGSSVAQLSSRTVSSLHKRRSSTERARSEGRDN